MCFISLFAKGENVDNNTLAFIGHHFKYDSEEYQLSKYYITGLAARDLNKVAEFWETLAESAVGPACGRTSLLLLLQFDATHM